MVVEGWCKGVLIVWGMTGRWRYGWGVSVCAILETWIPCYGESFPFLRDIRYDMSNGEFNASRITRRVLAKYRAIFDTITIDIERLPQKRRIAI